MLNFPLLKSLDFRPPLGLFFFPASFLAFLPFLALFETFLLCFFLAVLGLLDFLICLPDLSETMKYNTFSIKIDRERRPDPNVPCSV